MHIIQPLSRDSSSSWGFYPAVSGGAGNDPSTPHFTLHSGKLRESLIRTHCSSAEMLILALKEKPIERSLGRRWLGDTYITQLHKKPKVVS